MVSFLGHGFEPWSGALYCAVFGDWYTWQLDFNFFPALALCEDTRKVLEIGISGRLSKSVEISIELI